MARPPQKINAECGNRLKILLKETGTTQKALSETIHISQQTISQIIKGRANLTLQTAQLIIRAFPDYELHWLLGDLPLDMKAKADLDLFYDFRAQQLKHSLNLSVKLSEILSLCGIDTFIKNDGDFVIFRKNTSSEEAIVTGDQAIEYSEELLALIKAFVDYHFEKNKK